jgi:hypothetical protein
MVKKLLDISDNIDNKIYVSILSYLNGSAFYCPTYIKKLSHEKHLLYLRIKRLILNPICLTSRFFFILMGKYSQMSDFIKQLKKKIRTIRYKNYIKVIDGYFLNSDLRRGWSGLKKISKPSYSPCQSTS